jgi:signal transduction histidine kinase
VTDGAACEDVLGLHLGERALDCSRGCPLLGFAQDADAVEVWQDVPGDEHRRRPLLASAAVVAGAAEGEVEVVHSFRDITRLKQADEAKTLFLATASHELKTPLTVIRGFADMLLKHPEFPVERRELALDAIHRRARDLGAIVDRILLSSRIEAGRLSLANGPIDVVALVAERVAALSEAVARDVRFEHERPECTAYGNAAALTTVVDHLLDNAVKYSAADQPVEVRLVAESERVRIDVADRGVGMDEEQATHCFDKFWQADSTDAREHGGTGIGLYIVRSLTEAMLGDITVTSRPGAGSTFSVVLRVVSADHEIPGPRRPDGDVGAPEPSMVREFMRQLGLPTGGQR